MKKFLSVILSVSIFLMSGISAFAKIPEALLKDYENYTCNQTLTLNLKNADEFISLLDEMEIKSDIETFVDIKMMLKSLFLHTTEMKMQVDISNNYERVLMGITGESAQKFDLNPNLNMDINAKWGMWAELDISRDEPVVKIIYQQPYMNKYMVIDLLKSVSDEGEAAQLITELKATLDKEATKKHIMKTAELVEQYGKLGSVGKYFCIDLNNDAFINIINEYIAYVAQALGEDIISVPEGITVLGDNGLKVKCSVFNNNIADIELQADVCLDLSEICEVVYGEEWNYESDGKIEFEVKTKAKYSDISRTKVVFPEITEENSVDLSEALIPEEDTETLEYEENRTYPNIFASDYFSYIYTEGEEVYIPVRSAMVAAYEQQVDISYENGVITLSSEYFPGFKQLVIKLGNETAYLDGAPVNIGKIIFKDDTTYIRAKAIEEIFDWELVDASYNFIYNEYSYTFYTKNEQIEMY